MANKIRYQRHCVICQKRYSYCPYCDEYKHLEPWHDAYCSADCHDLYNIVAGYLNGWKTPEEEAERLKKINIPDRSKLSQQMDTAITALLAIGKKQPEPAKPEPVRETPKAETVKTEAIKEQPEVEPLKEEAVKPAAQEAQTKPQQKSGKYNNKYEQRRNKNMNAAATEGEKLAGEFKNFHGKPAQTKFKQEEKEQ